MHNTLRSALALLVLVAAPTLALADKDFDSGDGATYDCGDDGTVNINHDGGTYTLTGECTQVNVNGSNVTLTIADVDQLAINGAGNRATTALVQTILINGDKNSVRWKKAKAGRKPSVAITGTKNSVAKQR